MMWSRRNAKAFSHELRRKKIIYSLRVFSKTGLWVQDWLVVWFGLVNMFVTLGVIRADHGNLNLN